MELSMFLSLPASVALLIGSEEIISLYLDMVHLTKTQFLIPQKHYIILVRTTCFRFNKSFLEFFFAYHDTKTPFYISLASVILNVIISIYFFRIIGFIIIPIAHNIFWFNSILLFIYLRNKNFLVLVKYFGRVY